MGKRGPQPWAPTAEERKRIRLYSGLGLTQEQIATIIGKNVNVLHDRCREDMAMGKAEAIGTVAGTLFKKAAKGDNASMFFYLKTQAGWRETSRHEHTGANGGPIQTDSTWDLSGLSDEELELYRALRAKVSSRPPDDEGN